MEGTPRKIFNYIAISGAVIGVSLVLFGQLILPHLNTDCNPNYSPCVTNTTFDLNCPAIGHSVTVTGTDVYGLDRDGDGTGCETYDNGNILWSLIIAGAAGWFIAAWIGLFIAWGYEIYEGRKQKRHDHSYTSDES